MTVTFACGHRAEIAETASLPPQCGCGETRVQAVRARAPRFVGACTGPYSEFANLADVTVNLAPGGSLNVKPPKD